MKVLTWNVLHRTHAETHGEPVCARWPREHERTKHLVEFLAEQMLEHRVALLQEVSGDLYRALRDAFPGHAVLAHAYPRYPKQKVVTSSVTDRTEHLVILAPSGGHVLRAHTFENDSGKGFLLAWLPGGLSVLSTHVTWGDKRELQLAALGRVLREGAGPLVIGGDFNAGRDVVAEALGVERAIGVLPPGSLPTRPGSAPNEAADIDHLIVRGGVLHDVRVLEHPELSDHRPVSATFEPH